MLAILRKRGFRDALAGLALLIAASRVLCSVHWPSDVLAGLAFGAAVGFAGFAVFFAVIG